MKRFPYTRRAQPRRDLFPLVETSEFHLLAGRLGWSVGSAVAQGEELFRRWMYEQERLGLLKLNPPRPRQP